MIAERQKEEESDVANSTAVADDDDGGDDDGDDDDGGATDVPFGRSPLGAAVTVFGCGVGGGDRCEVWQCQECDVTGLGGVAEAD